MSNNNLDIKKIYNEALNNIISIDINQENKELKKLVYQLIKLNYNFSEKNHNEVITQLQSEIKKLYEHNEQLIGYIKQLQSNISNLESENKDLKNDNQGLQNTIKKLESDVKILNLSINNLRNKNKNLNTENKKLTKENRDLKLNIENYKNKIKELEDKINEMELYYIDHMEKLDFCIKFSKENNYDINLNILKEVYKIGIILSNENNKLKNFYNNYIEKLCKLRELIKYLLEMNNIIGIDFFNDFLKIIIPDMQIITVQNFENEKFFIYNDFNKEYYGKLFHYIKYDQIFIYYNKLNLKISEQGKNLINKLNISYKEIKGDYEIDQDDLKLDKLINVLNNREFTFNSSVQKIDLNTIFANFIAQNYRFFLTVYYNEIIDKKTSLENKNIFLKNIFEINKVNTKQYYIKIFQNIKNFIDDKKNKEDIYQNIPSDKININDFLLVCKIISPIFIDIIADNIEKDIRYFNFSSHNNIYHISGDIEKKYIDFEDKNNICAKDFIILTNPNIYEFAEYNINDKFYYKVMYENNNAPSSKFTSNNVSIFRGKTYLIIQKIKGEKFYEPINLSTDF